MAVIYMTGVLVRLFVGALALKFVGVGIPALRIAGGANRSGRFFDG